MAISAVAGIASAIGAAAAAAAKAGFFSTLFSLAGAKAFAIGAGLSMVSRALAPKPSLGAQLRGMTTTVRDPAGSRKIIYGETRVGGQVVFIANSGDDNEYLHLAIAFATHRIEDYEEFWFNDNKVWEDGSVLTGWTDVLEVVTRKGQQTSAMASLKNASTEWTDNHILEGIAYVHFKLKWDPDKFPQGVPNISARIQGRRVYDPRKDSTSSVYDSSLGVSSHRSDQSGTWQYSTNPALIVRDYLVDSKYGLGEDASLVDLDALHAAADLCDESVTLADTTTQKRFECHGVIDTANSIKDNIEQLLSSMGGRLSYSGGKYYIDGAEYRTPEVTFTESDCIADIQLQTKQSRRSAFNGVKGIFVSEEKNYKVMDYPPQISSTYALQDGDPIYLDMPLPFVTNNIQAQRLAKIALLKSREQTVINMAVNLKGLQVKIGDTIKVTNDRIGYTEKVFEVIDYSLAINSDGVLGVNLQCIETASAVYDWTTDDEEDFLSGGELPLYDGRTVDNVTSLTATEVALISPDGTLKTNMQLTWTAPQDAFIDYYNVRYNETGTTDYFYLITREPRILISGLDKGSNYDFRVQATNLIGVSSTGTELLNQLMEGDDTAPPAPTGMSATGGIQTITAEWNNPTGNDALDFKHVEVFVSDSDSIPADPTAIIDGEEYVVTGLSGAVTRYFWLKSVDFSGNKSAATASFNGASVQAGSADIGDGAVGSSEIADNAVGTDQLADGAVDITAFASGINPVQVVDALPDVSGASQGDLVFLTTDNNLYRFNGTAWTKAITLSEVSDAGALAALETVGTSQIDDDAITNAQIAVDAITSDVIAAGAITTTTIADDAISTAKIAAGAITASEIAAGAITATEIAAGAITATELAANSVTANAIATGAVAADEIAAGSIVTAKIAAGAVTANEIAANVITAGQIATGAISTDELAANAVTSDKISVTNLAAINSDLGTLTAGTIDATNVAISNLNADNITAGELSANRISIDGATLSVSGDNLIVATGGVGTTQIASSAVTGIQVDYNSSTNATQITGTNAVTYNSATDEGDVTLTTVGGSVDIVAGFEFWAAGSAYYSNVYTTVQLWIWRKEGTTYTRIYSTNEIKVHRDQGLQLSVNIVDTPAAGTYTYIMQIGRIPSYTVYGRFPYLRALELKR